MAADQSETRLRDRRRNRSKRGAETNERTIDALTVTGVRTDEHVEVLVGTWFCMNADRIATHDEVFNPVSVERE
jgi:hypothetical protein